MNKKAFFNVESGLYVLTAKSGEKDNGCVINTFMQLSNSSKPLVAVSVNKANYTCELISQSGVFAVNVLTESTPFRLIEHFGFKSGRDTQKFFKNENEKRAQNGCLYLPQFTNAYFACRVKETIDCGDHLLFIAETEEAEVLSAENSLSYDYYHKNIKPKPQPEAKGWRCKICGYVYDGEKLPEDFICPLCKHGAEDFEKI